MAYYNAQDSISFKQIVLEHMKKILEISTHEFRGGRVEMRVNQGVSQEVYVPDTRKAYIQAVESMADILFPYFDKEIEPFFEDLEKKSTELRGEYNKTNAVEGSVEHDSYVGNKLILVRKLFRELNLLLHRIDYLKTAIYGDTDEVVEVD